MSAKTKEKSERVSAIQELKKRVAAIKPILAANYGWRRILLSHYPEYDTAQNGQLVNNVYTLRSSDAKLTAILEAIAKGELNLKEEEAPTAALDEKKEAA